MPRGAYEDDRIDDTGMRVDNRRAGDPGRVDVAARKVAAPHWRAEVGAPLKLAADSIERVDRVVLGCHDHLAARDEGLGIDVPVDSR